MSNAETFCVITGENNWMRLWIGSGWHTWWPGLWLKIFLEHLLKQTETWVCTRPSCKLFRDPRVPRMSFSPSYWPVLPKGKSGTHGRQTARGTWTKTRKHAGAPETPQGKGVVDDTDTTSRPASAPSPLSAQPRTAQDKHWAFQTLLLLGKHSDNLDHPQKQACLAGWLTSALPSEAADGICR